jgi:hypothetical protein
MRIGAGEYNRDQMNRSEAQRRFANLIHYRVRPLLADRSKSDADRVIMMKRLVREANSIRVESGAVAGLGTREEIIELLLPWLKPDAPTSEELRNWIVRVFRAFGASYETEDFE